MAIKVFAIVMFAAVLLAALSPRRVSLYDVRALLLIALVIVGAAALGWDMGGGKK